MFARHPKKLLLTGRPGVGKTTIIMRLRELLREKNIAGFYTEEIRTDKGRQGFRIVTMSGICGTLAHVAIRSTRRVGRYGVDVRAFERLVLPELVRSCELLLMDEIGKMECYSAAFIDCARNLLNGMSPVVATIAGKGGGFIAEVKGRTDVDVVEVTPANRDGLPAGLAARLSS